MIAFFTTLLRLFLQAFRSKRNILSENALLKKENEILVRRLGKKRVHFDFYDKLFLVALHRAADIKHRLTLVEPETVLYWQRALLKLDISLRTKTIRKILQSFRRRGKIRRSLRPSAINDIILPRTEF